MGSNEDEMALLVAAPQLRRSPRRHGSDSDLDTTVGTTGMFLKVISMSIVMSEEC